jgi:hypothetical protein
VCGGIPGPSWRRPQIKLWKNPSVYATGKTEKVAVVLVFFNNINRKNTSNHSNATQLEKSDCCCGCWCCPSIGMYQNLPSFGRS